MRLVDLQAAVHALVRHTTPLDEAARALAVPAERLGIYRDFVSGHITRVLAKVYAYCHACLPRATWDALALSFYTEVPARERELNACVAPFAGWLAARGDAALPPFLATLAQLEWELFAAWSHEADVVPEPAAPWSVNPTLALLETRWAVVPWLVQHPEAAALTPATTGPDALVTPQLALVFRRAAEPPPGHRIAFHVATGNLLFAIKVASEGVPLAAAADLAGVAREAAEAAMAEAVAIGLVLERNSLSG